MLKGDELPKLKKYQKLETIALGGNLIKTIDEVKFFKDFPHLISLDLFNNPVAANDNYRKKMFEMLPQLKV